MSIAAPSASRPPLVWPAGPVSPLALAILVAVVLMALAPIGYVGGGWDDRHYLEAARCAAGEGFCLPADHWARRFTLVVPTGAVIALLGESRQSLWLVPAAYSLVAVTFFTLAVARGFGRRAALIAGPLCAAMPVFSQRMLDLGVDTAELALLCAAAYALLRGVEDGGARWPAGAGVLLGLAILTRPTTFALLPLAVGALLVAQRSRAIAPFLAAVVACIVAEALFYAVWVGDPLLPWRLSLAHTTIPSTELAAGVDLSRSPLFNVDFIDNWRPAAGIQLHWTIDAFLNLLASPSMIVLPVALLLLVLRRRDLGTARAGGAALLLLVAGAALYFGALVYGFAIDPKPRMFLPVAAAACTVIGVLGSLAWAQGRRLLVGVLVGLVAMNALVDAIARTGGDPIAAAMAPLPAD